VREPDQLDEGADYDPMNPANSGEHRGKYDPMNPANSAPMVAWLASDQAMHVTGQVFRAVGHRISHYKPWSLGVTIEPKGQPTRWEAEDIGPAVNAQIFGSRAPGLQIGG